MGVFKWVLGAVGAIVGIGLAPLTGGASIVAGAALGFGLGDSIDDRVQAQKDATTAATLATEDATNTQAAIDLESQNQSISYQNTIRQAKANEMATDSQATNISEESRKAEISAFQAESAGEAAAAQSGLSGGSTYMALEASVAENERSIKSWFDSASQGLEIAGMQATTTMQQSGQNYRQSDLQQTLLATQKSKHEFDATKFEREASSENLWSGIVGDTLSTAVDAIKLYTGFAEMFPADKSKGKSTTTSYGPSAPQQTQNIQPFVSMPSAPATFGATSGTRGFTTTNPLLSLSGSNDQAMMNMTPLSSLIYKNRSRAKASMVL